MMRRGWILAIVLVVVFNVIILVGVALNRTGEPDAAIVLTERELPIGYTPEENTGILLQLSWGRDWQGPEWLDADKLEELGFDCSVPVEAATEELYYDKQLPREAFVVLELEGDAWARWLEEQEREIAELAAEVERGEATQEQLERRRGSLEVERKTRSRLHAIDADADPLELRSRYPDRGRFIVVPAVIDIRVDREWDSETERMGPPELRGWIRRILVDHIHVSRAHREIFEPFRENPNRSEGPRYRVTVAFGSRYQPWIVEAEPMTERGGS